MANTPGLPYASGNVGTINVTSFSLDMPAEFSVSGSPLIGSGGITVSKVSENANTLWAGPVSGISGVPSFRNLVISDLPIGVGTVTSVTFTGDGTVLSATPSSAVTGAGTLSASLNAQVKNTILAGPSSGSNANPTFRNLTGLDLPNPSSSSLGGVESYAAVSHQFINTISTTGAISSAQPGFNDISGTIASAQVTGSYTGVTGVGSITTGTWLGTTIAVVHGGTGDTGTAWTAYTPTVTASAGTFTSVSATGRYKRGLYTCLANSPEKRQPTSTVPFP